MSAESVFVDSNILLYAHDLDAGAKRTMAQAALARLARERTGVLSMQVLQEFYVNATRKLAHPLPRAEARAIVSDFSYWCVPTTPREIQDAFRMEDEAKISFWDAMIVSAAVKAGASCLFTEDMSHGQVIAGIRIENPFAGRT
ncbi:MAG TPA: PIN domain-containing protein [Terracidiphilus sp.]|jgi:predicted nucleic acid-binding protein|nr:PIN domain-containing protein [Terracidiphilus sp.]